MSIYGRSILEEKKATELRRQNVTKVLGMPYEMVGKTNFKEKERER